MNIESKRRLLPLLLAAGVLAVSSGARAAIVEIDPEMLGAVQAALPGVAGGAAGVVAQNLAAMNPGAAPTLQAYSSLLPHLPPDIDHFRQAPEQFLRVALEQRYAEANAQAWKVVDRHDAGGAIPERIEEDSRRMLTEELPFLDPRTAGSLKDVHAASQEAESRSEKKVKAAMNATASALQEETAESRSRDNDVRAWEIIRQHDKGMSLVERLEENLRDARRLISPKEEPFIGKATRAQLKGIVPNLRDRLEERTAAIEGRAASPASARKIDWEAVNAAALKIHEIAKDAPGYKGLAFVKDDGNGNLPYFNVYVRQIDLDFAQKMPKSIEGLWVRIMEKPDLKDAPMVARSLLLWLKQHPRHDNVLAVAAAENGELHVSVRDASPEAVKWIGSSFLGRRVVVKKQA